MNEQDEMNYAHGVYQPGEAIGFTAQRTCKLRGQSYRKGDEIVIRLKRQWIEPDGIGEGGPWGYGGYTSRFVASLGEVVR